MQKKQYWNVKTLVFMALLIAMHLVLTRVLVIDLGAYRISVGSVCTIDVYKRQICESADNVSQISG